MGQNQRREDELRCREDAVKQVYARFDQQQDELRARQHDIETREQRVAEQETHVFACAQRVMEREEALEALDGIEELSSSFKQVG